MFPTSHVYLLTHKHTHGSYQSFKTILVNFKIQTINNSQDIVQQSQAIMGYTSKSDLKLNPCNEVLIFLWF